MKFENIADAVGRTPIVRINRLTEDGSADLYVKLESFNPCSSVKDRIGVAMVAEAEKSGALKPGMTIVEPTSGNTGIALAMVAAAKGYRCVLTMPDTMSVERRAVIKQFGAEIVLTPGDKGMKGAIARGEELLAEGNCWMASQFSNPANPEIHARTTAREIIDDLGETKLDVFIAGVGTGGTIAGAGRVLKEHYGCRVIAIEPTDSPVLSGGEPGPHKIQGIGAGFVPDNYDPDVVDEVITVTNEAAFAMAKKMASHEGLLVGISSGAITKIAVDVAKKIGTGKTIVSVVCDHGERYLSTPLFDKDDV